MVKPKKSTAKELQAIFNKHGRHSSILYKYIKGFLHFLIFRYYSDYRGGLFEEDDLLQECQIKIFNSLDYYDPAKGNLATFLYCALRNTIGYLRREEKKVAKFYSNLSDDNNSKYHDSKGSRIEEARRVEDNDLEFLESSICRINILDSFGNNILFSEQFRVDYINRLYKYPILDKVVLWREMMSY